MKSQVKLGMLFAVVFSLIACSEKTETEAKQKEPSLGEKVVNANCRACHGQGLNGAPIIGNKKMWGKRITQGVPTLIEHATNGYGLMPAKGGNAALTDAEISAAVNYFVDQVK